MIKNSFIFLEGVSHTSEKNLKKQRIKTWNDFLEKKHIKGMGKVRKGYYDRKLLEAKENLIKNNSSYFINKLPQSETWRLYNYFRDEACFLDIEISNVDDGFITLIGIYDGIETKTMIKNVNLDTNKLKQELEKYKLIVTFNGATFDIPFIKKKYPNLLPNIPNFDLRTACNRIGLKGGLKQIEAQLKIKRQNNIVEKMYNGDPFKLWKMFQASGDKYYLKLLIEYNEEDIINLKSIADHVVNELFLLNV